MKAIAVYPGQPDSMHVEEVPEPKVTDIPDGHGVLVRVLRVGVDGTDKEINAAEYGGAPEGLNADGLTGEEGTFVVCSFWLVSCLAKAGEIERAERLYDQLAGYANDLGLLAEEIDTPGGEPLGNFPQAYSHIGLITAAAEIDQARGVA